MATELEQAKERIRELERHELELMRAVWNAHCLIQYFLKMGGLSNADIEEVNRLLEQQEKAS